MLGKKFSLGSVVEETGEARIKLANFDELREQGSDIASFISTFKPDPGYVYLHVIAMGAGEYYGCNINGDYFPEKDLIERHHTFVTNAKVFKEHDNKPTSPSYGHVVFSWYNPKMHRVELILAIDKVKGKEFVDRQARGEQLEVSMGCFPAGTPILMEGGGQKPIEDVRVGDMVITHEMRPKKVTALLTYPFTGTMVILILGDGRHLVCTGNHPLYTWHPETDTTTWEPAISLRAGDTVWQHDSDHNPMSKLSIAQVYHAHVDGVKVYNFSVEDDESYVANSVYAHNCKVRADVCSICGNKARKRSDYCEHILRDKRKIYPDGRQPYMINYNPTFFDISIVRRRADKIAYVLEKVASRDTTVSSLNAQAFDELDSLIPFAEPPQVFDIEEDFEKTANVEKKAADLDKLAMIKRIQSEAVKVLNTGLEETMPLLEATEPDLPPALLDAMAKKHRLEDIMTTFTVNAIPMKPEEFTRIIIVKRGLPLDTFADVLKGVKSAVADRDLKMGEYKDDIGKTLQAYLIARSSFLPAVISRLAGALRNRDALSKTAATLKLDVPTNYWELNPALTFGHAKNPPSYTNIESAVAPGAHVIQRYDYSTLPVVRSPQELEMERRRPKLREPMSPLTVGAILGGLYAAYRSSSAVRAVLDSPKNMAILMALAALIHKKMGAPTSTDMQQVKTASWGTAAAKVAIPFVGAHFASAHFRNLYNNGVPLNSVERYIAENPDILSIAAPIVVNAALKGHANVKTASCDIENSEFMQKFAEVSDSLAEFANNAMLGIILPSKRRSILSNVIDQTIDSKLMNKLLPG